jgi:hypothetical protein
MTLGFSIDQKSLRSVDVSPIIAHMNTNTPLHWESNHHYDQLLDYEGEKSRRIDRLAGDVAADYYDALMSGDPLALVELPPYQWRGYTKKVPIVERVSCQLCSTPGNVLYPLLRLLVDAANGANVKQAAIDVCLSLAREHGLAVAEAEEGMS